MTTRQQEISRTTMTVDQRKRTGKKTDSTTATRKATQTMHRTRKPVGKMLLFGGASLAMYLTVFLNEGMVTNTFTLGGWHAAFPVLTAFAFSFVHGAFASNFLSVLGLEAKKR